MARGRKKVHPYPGLGAKIREARLALGMSGREFGDAVGSNKALVSQWERDLFVPSEAKILLIEKALGIELHRVLRDARGRRADGERECPTCNKIFVGAHDQVYCSPACFYERNPKKTKICPTCENEFVPDVPGRTYCSLECKHTGLRRPDKPKECAHCHGPMPLGVPFRQKYCSHSCSAQAVYRGRRRIADGDRRIDQNKGYAFVKVGGHWLLEHRVVMERVLGRRLLPGENVHHKNGDRADNRPENLELWVRPQPCGGRVEDLIEQALAADILADLPVQWRDAVRSALMGVFGVDRTGLSNRRSPDDARDVTPPASTVAAAPPRQALLDFGSAD